MKRAVAAMVGLALVVGACSSKKAEQSGTPAGASPGSSIETVPADAELGSPILDGNDKGHYVPLRSPDSYDTLKGGSTTPTNQNGLLLAVSNAAGGPFIISMEDDTARYLRVNKGWKIDELGRDPSWRPVLSAGVPELAVGSRWVVALRTQTPDGSTAGDQGDQSDREGVTSGALIEAYDSTDKTYFTTTAIDPSHSLFTNTLRAVDDQHFSFLYADGGVDDNRIPYIIRRTVDLTTFRFVDEAIDIGNTNRMVAATAMDDGYVISLERPKSQRDGVFVRLDAGSTDSTLQLTMKEAPTPDTIDGFRIDGAAKSLTLTSASGAKTPLPADFMSASIAGAVKNLVYLHYVGSPAKAISADGLALVDVSKGTVTTAFDLSGTNHDATGPSADAAWATGASRVVLVGVPIP